jgi:serine/threonine-protein kinase
MPLAPSSRLGPYEILSALGAGGMGEVYKARDTRLDRTVAIKVLPAAGAGDPERRQRLEREARAIAALNHPHICGLYDVGHHEGTDFLVMEFLDGETLSDRLARAGGAGLPLDEALRHAVEIADALDQAHRLGIVHRDLKPGNVMLARSGARAGPPVAKLLDFGLAKFGSVPAGRTAPGLPVTAMSSRSDAPTSLSPVTVEGAILGTMQYMSPEQLEGRPADSRSDIFAFGALLYEMVTGRKAFEGATQASVIGAILHTEPPRISAVAPLAPPALERIVRRCLAKDPEERWQSARDLMLELRQIRDDAGAPVPVPDRRADATPPRARAFPYLVAGGALAAGALAGALGMDLVAPRSDAPAQVLRFALPYAPRLAAYETRPFVVTPDGRRLVSLVREENGATRLYVRPFDQVDASPLEGTEGARSPFASPDGQSAGFFAGGKMKKVSFGGGLPAIVCDAPEERGAVWLADGTIIFAPTASGPLFRVPDEGGTPQEVTRLAPGEVSHRYPALVPGSDVLLFTVFRAGTFSLSRALVAAQPLSGDHAGDPRQVVVEARTDPHVLPSGHLMFVQPGPLLGPPGGTLFAAPFDPRTGALTGPALAVMDRVMSDSATGEAAISVSTGGTAVYVTAPAPPLKKLYWVDRTGSATPIPVPPRPYYEPRLSPDGRRASLNLREARWSVWMADLSRGTVTRVTGEQVQARSAIWTPDGSQLVFQRWKDGEAGVLAAQSPHAVGEGETLADAELWPTSMTPDGSTVAGTTVTMSTRADIVLVMLGDRGRQTPFAQSTSVEWNAAFSPDGGLLAYTSAESGQPHVYVRRLRGAPERLQISTGGGDHPVWSRNGRELFYRAGTKMMAVGLGTGPELSAGVPVELFDKETDPEFDVAPDGRFLMLMNDGPAPQPQMIVTVGWLEELKRRAASR